MFVRLLDKHISMQIQKKRRIDSERFRWNMKVEKEETRKRKLFTVMVIGEGM